MTVRRALACLLVAAVAVLAAQVAALAHAMRLRDDITAPL